MSNLRDWTENVKLERFCVLRSCFGGGRDIFCLMRWPGILRNPRRFPPPWSVEEDCAQWCDHWRL